LAIAVGPDVCCCDKAVWPGRRLEVREEAKPRAAACRCAAVEPKFAAKLKAVDALRPAQRVAVRPQRSLIPGSGCDIAPCRVPAETISRGSGSSDRIAHWNTSTHIRKEQEPVDSGRQVRIDLVQVRIDIPRGDDVGARYAIPELCLVHNRRRQCRYKAGRDDCRPMVILVAPRAG
jgi:hypothetical protein